VVFFHFIHNFIRKKEYEGEIYHKEKQLLRLIAALKHIHENNLVETKVDDKDSRINLDGVISKFDTFKGINNFREIYKSYLSPPIDNDKTVNFVHQTIGEYLLAEYYIDNLLWSRTHRLNVGKPSESTIDFLDGLLNLLKQDLEKEGINKIFDEFVRPDQLRNRRAHLKEIAKNALNSIVKDNVIFLELNKSDPDVPPDVMWTSVNSKHKNYKYQWIHKWIASFILNNMINDKSPIKDEQEKKRSEIKEKLVELIAFSGRLGIPNYLKRLNNFDLSDANLIETNLSAADFSNNKHLVCANFFYAKLTYANFSNSNLSFANFWRANLKNINFHKACLSGANMYLVEIRGSKLEAADLTYAELSGANLARSNLLNANLSGANLSGATMDVKQYDGLKCYNANIDNIKTKDRKLLDYLMKESKKSPESDKAVINKGSSVSLTGKWRSNDGGTYYVNKIGNTV
jgi:uncharacterized protein YjbI with pentapeptide repeats